MENSRFFTHKISTVNGIMCVMVVFLHSYNIERYTNLKYSMTEYFESLISQTIGDLAVPGFFFMSSILFFQNYSIDKLWQKYRSRFFSCFIPYILWNIIYLIAFIVLTAFPITNSFMDTKELQLNLRIILEAVFLHKYNGAFWFIYQLLLFVIVSPFIFIIVKRKWGIFLAFLLMIMRFKTNRIPNIPDGLMVNSLIYWVLGAWFVIHKRELIYHRCNKRNICLLGAIIFVVIRFVYEFLLGSEINYCILDILLLINVLFVWFGFDVLNFNKTYDRMKMSFFIYALHPLVVDAIKKGVSVLLPDNDFMALANYFISALFGIIICLGIAHLLSCYFPQVLRLLCGGRVKAHIVDK